MSIVFLGSGDFARDLLEYLIRNGVEIEAVVTRPDRPSGRGLHHHSTPVKILSEEAGLTVFQPQAPTEQEFAETLKELHPDFLLVADYGHILPNAILVLPPRGCINVHPSLLPRYRGASPIQRALMDGVEITGATLMLMDEGLDTGPIISQTEIVVEEDDDAGALRVILAALAARLVLEVIPIYISGAISPQSQDESRATYADAIEKSELAIDWTLTNRAIHNQVRALSPRPGAYAYFRGKRVRILRTILDDVDKDLVAGEIRASAKSPLIAGTGSGALTLETLQPEGRKVMSAAEFIRGYRLKPGEGFAGAPL